MQLWLLAEEIITRTVGPKMKRLFIALTRSHTGGASTPPTRFRVYDGLHKQLDKGARATSAEVEGAIEALLLASRTFSRKAAEANSLQVWFGHSVGRSAKRDSSLYC